MVSEFKIDKKIIYILSFFILVISVSVAYSYINSDLNYSSNVSMNSHKTSTNNLYDMISYYATPDNMPSKHLTSNSINFYNSSSETNGKGIYTIASTLGNTYPIHYYRGNVDNNNVKFAGYCWQIVRTSDTGGIKIIYNGTYSDDTKCNNTGENSVLTIAKYNSSHSPNYVGYMSGKLYKTNTISKENLNKKYLFSNDVTWNGTKYTLVDTIETTGDWTIDYTSVNNAHHYTCLLDSTALSCSTVYYFQYADSENGYYTILEEGEKIEDAWAKAMENETDSSIKQYVENWYAESLLDYQSYIEDTIYCNNRKTTSSWNKDKNLNESDKIIHFDSSRRNLLKENINIDLTCDQKDSFTVSDTIGNGKNKYPIGLITFDEAILSGVGDNTTSSYIFTGTPFFTMSPHHYNNTGFSHVFYITGLGHDEMNVGIAQGYRPVISLKNTTTFQSGNGTASDPYIIN